MPISLVLCMMSWDITKYFYVFSSKDSLNPFIFPKRPCIALSGKLVRFHLPHNSLILKK